MALLVGDQVARYQWGISAPALHFFQYNASPSNPPKAEARPPTC